MHKDVQEVLNKYLADIAVLYIKLHNLHWNVVGTQFKSVHEYFETMYNEFALLLDGTAELLKITGAYPLASMKDYVKVTSLEELDSKNISISEAFEIVLSDMTHMQASAEKIRQIANQHDYYTVVSTLEEHLKSYNKTMWFLEAMLKQEKS